jgi:hypothetical protein
MIDIAQKIESLLRHSHLSRLAESPIADFLSQSRNHQPNCDANTNYPDVHIVVIFLLLAF